MPREPIDHDLPPLVHEGTRTVEELEIFYNLFPDMIGSGNLEGYFSRVNSAFTRILGHSAQQICARPFLDFVHPDDLDLTRQALEAAGRGRREIFVENRYRCQDGHYKWIEWKVLAHADKNQFFAVGRDITRRKADEEERRELQERLNQAAKMEAIGLLAGSVAHDLNNILSGVVSYPELLLLDLPQESPLRPGLEVVMHAGLRAREVVDDLLTLARGMARKRELVQLNAIIDELLRSPEYTTQLERFPRVQVEIQLSPDLSPIDGSPVHLRKAVLNLVVNAMEATGGADGGQVALRTDNVNLQLPLQGHELVPAGRFVRLTVRDDGEGIPGDATEHIFEPFYSRKKMGRSGSGLGLYVVWNAAHDHGGYINVVSGGEGTAFELYLPCAEDAAPRDLPQPGALNHGHGETILVVDDEALQRQIACDILRRLGYRAAAVSSGEEAVEYLGRHQVDLLLLDMVMPGGMNGQQTYQAVKARYPHQRALVVSGLSADADVTATQRMGAGDLVRKPYTIEAIGRAVGRELGRQG